MRERQLDIEFQTQVLSKVEEYPDGWVVTGDCGCLIIPKYSDVPKVGDQITYYGKGFGYPVRGVVINGIEVYYNTSEEYERQREQEIADSKRNRRLEYADAKDGNTARINALPGPLQKRLFQFRKRSDDFGPEFEGYELAIAEMSTQVALACERHAAGQSEQWFETFRKAEWSEQASVFGIPMNVVDEIKTKQPQAEQEAPQTEESLFQKLLQQKHTYTPFGESEEMTLTPWHVQKFLAVPTKQGHLPTVQDCVKFCIMCRQRQLNPWAGDCYMIGYDTNDGPKFSVVTAIQALLSRAELNTAFDGMESGVVVQRADILADGKATQVIEERQGDLTYTGETLLGGWCRIYRKDRKVNFYQRLKLSTYAKTTPMWRQDGAGMICKCAEAGALRQAFPSVIGGLYLRDEIEAFNTPTAPKAANTEGAVNLDVLAGHGPIITQAPEVAAGANGNGSHAVDDGGTAGGTVSGDEASQEAVNEASQLPPEEELLGWLHDIDTCQTNGALDKLAQEVGTSSLSGTVRDRILKAIGDRRSALKAKNGGAKKEQPGLPGAQS